MNQIISWLKGNKRRTAIITIVYFLLVILPHEWVGIQISALFSSFTRSSYDLIILSISLLILFLVGLTFWKKIMQHKERTMLLFYFGLTLFFIVLVNNFLFVANIEIVHYVQYAIGAILLFTLLGNYFAVLFVAFLISLFDEGYQYFYLTPENTNYFDFNDIITDFLGTVFGLLLLKTLSVKEWGNRKNKMKWGLFVPFFIFILSFTSLVQTSYLSIFPSDDKFNIVKKIEDGFWTTVPQKINMPSLAIAEYLKEYPDDEIAQKLSKELKRVIRTRNASFTQKTGIQFGQKTKDGKSISYSLLIKKLAESGDAEFSSLVKEVNSTQNDVANHLREFWSSGIPEKYLSKQFPEITFHVVKPLEGLIILSSLFALYFFCFQAMTEEMN